MMKLITAGNNVCLAGSVCTVDRCAAITAYQFDICRNFYFIGKVHFGLIMTGDDNDGSSNRKAKSR